MNPWEMDWSGQAAQSAPWDMKWSDEEKPVTDTDRAKVVAPAVNQGLVNLAGMPVDTVLNLANLARAGYGYLGNKLGALPAERMPSLLDPAQFPGSSSWLTNKIGQAGAGGLVENPNPQDPTSRMIYAGGQAVAPVLFGGAPAVTAARAVPTGITGNIAAQFAAEQGLPESGQILAQMMTQAGVTSGAKMGQVAQQRADQRNLSSQVRSENLREAQQAGYKFPPLDVNLEAPGVLNRVMTALGQKVATNQEISVANTFLTDTLAKKYVGLPKTEPITEAGLQSLRSNAGAAYDTVRQTGTIPTTQNYIREVISAQNNYLKGAQNNRSLASKDAELALQDAMKPSFTGDQAVELVKKLRNAGFKNQQSDDPVKETTGKTQLAVSRALDNLIAEHLRTNGTPQQYNDYITARETIARSYTIENALNKATGHVDAKKLASDFAHGKPLSDEALTIAKTASIVPQGLSQVTSGQPGLGTMMGWGGLGAVGSVLSGNPAFMALQFAPALRPAARKIMASGPYQRKFATPKEYEAGMLARIMPEMFGTDISPLFGTYAVPYQK